MINMSGNFTPSVFFIKRSTELVKKVFQNLVEKNVRFSDEKIFTFNSFTYNLQKLFSK